jgi:hypothetical protein
MNIQLGSFSRSLILLVIILFSTVNCSKKKGGGLFWLLLAAGGGTSVSEVNVDSNGVPLPENLGTNTENGTVPISLAEQEVPTSGAASIRGNFYATIANQPSGDVCGEPGAPISPNCLDFTAITAKLVAPNATVVSSQKLLANGSFQFDIDNLPNNNYRVLIETGFGLNYAHRDFLFTFDPTSAQSITIINLGSIAAERLFYTSGPASFTGTVNTSGFAGDVNVPAGPVQGVLVQVIDSQGNVIASTTTDSSGNYSINLPNLSNGNYTIILDGSDVTAMGQNFSTTSQDIHFVFEGTNSAVVTQVIVPTSNLQWLAATSSSATVSGSIMNAAISGDVTTVYTINLFNSSGNLVATTSITGSGSYSFGASNLTAGVYSIQISGSSSGNTITFPASSSFLFTPHSSGGNKIVNVPTVYVAPRQSNITGQVTDGTLSYVPGSVINFRPASNQAPSNLLYLLNDDQIRDMIKLWLVEAGLGICAANNFEASCVVANQGSGPWNYTTFGNKVYEVKPDQSVFFTAAAGKWAYYISAPGYSNYCGGNTNCLSDPLTLTLNGQDYNAGSFTLLASTKRSQITGNLNVRDQIIGSSSVTNNALSGIFVILLGNTDTAGNAVAHITTTSSGNFAFNGSSKVVVLPSGLPNDQARAGVAINAYLASSIIPGLPVLNAISLASAANIVGTASSSIHEVNGDYNFKQSSYQLLVVDPLGHINSASFGADNGLVATNSYTISPVVFNLSSNVNHLPRKQITGSIFNAISTAGIGSATVELGRYDSSNAFVADIRRDCSTSDGISSLNCSIPNSNRLTQPRIDQLVEAISVNSNGSFTINNINPGNYILKISGNGYQDQYVSINVPSQGDATPVSVGLVPNVGTGNLTGSIKIPGGFSFTGSYNLEILHPVSGNRPLSGVQPSSLSNGLSSFSNAPQYNVFNLSAGQWKVRFISAGYITVEGLVNIQANATTNFDIITMVPGTQTPAAIAGRAINAITNSSSGMNGLQVRIRPGINITSGPFATAQDGVTILPLATTANDGSFAIVNVPAGNYTLEVKGSNVATAYRTVVSAGSDTPSSQNILVSPILNNDEVRVVLSWNEEPRDLDSHLEYGSSAPHQVVWNDKSKLGGDLTLDVDVVTGFGPETVTLKGSAWSQSRRGYSVYNWSRECKSRNFYGSCTDYAELYESGAIVRVYRSTGLVRSYVVGNTQVGRWWQMFCFNSDKSIVDVGSAGCSQSSFFNASRN